VLQAVIAKPCGAKELEKARKVVAISSRRRLKSA